jgi:hypothetical protein
MGIPKRGQKRAIFDPLFDPLFRGQKRGHFDPPFWTPFWTILGGSKNDPPKKTRFVGQSAPSGSKKGSKRGVFGDFERQKGPFPYQNALFDFSPPKPPLIFVKKALFRISPKAAGRFPGGPLLGPPLEPLKRVKKGRFWSFFDQKWSKMRVFKKSGKNGDF